MADHLLRGRLIAEKIPPFSGSTASAILGGRKNEGPLAHDGERPFAFGASSGRGGR